MNILFVLIPLSVALLGFGVWCLFWAIDSGQFDDLDEVARSIPGDDEPESR
jgi:cbb3-type cytochrome oxidase maturation protein